VVLDGLCALRAQPQIVLDRPAVVAMPLELDGGLRVVTQPGDVLVELGARRLVDVVAVVVEVDVLQRAALGGTEASPRPIETAAESLFADTLAAADTFLRRGALLGTPSSEHRQAAQGGRPARHRSPRIPHAHHLSPAARTTLAGYHRRFRWSIVSAYVRRDPPSRANGVRCATTRRPGSARRGPTTDPRWCRHR